eukprot:scaffold409_cov167-Ochromonas_danica.AAC.26
MGIVNDDFTICMGGLGSLTKVTHFSTQVLNPSQAYTNTVWKNYGGADVQPAVNYTSRMRKADEASHIVFATTSLAPGEVAQYDYTHIMQKQSILKAMRELEMLTIAQPTDTSSALVSDQSTQRKWTNLGLNANGYAQLKVEVTVNNVIYHKQKAIMIQNEGRRLYNNNNDIIISIIL